MPALPRPTRDEIQSRVFRRLQQELPIVASLESSVFGLIVKVCAAEFDLMWSEMDRAVQQSNITTATGPALEALGLKYGLPRRQERAASTLGLQRAVRFTNLGNASALIPAGTRVYKQESPNIAFFTDEGITLQPGQAGEVHVSAPETGDVYNVGIGELNAQAAPGVTVAVTNILPIQNGSGAESDGSYRERILQAIRQRSGLTPDSLIAMLRGVPGVRDAYLVDLARGAGTFDVYIIPYEDEQTSQVVAQCQTLMNSVVSVGVSAKAKAPTYRQLDVRVVMSFSDGVAGSRDAIRESVRAQITSLVSNLPVENGSGNGTLYLPRIRALAIASDTGVVDAVVDLRLDDSPLSSDGEVKLTIGERIILRGLSVQ